MIYLTASTTAIQSRKMTTLIDFTISQPAPGERIFVKDEKSEFVPATYQGSRQTTGGHIYCFNVDFGRVTSSYCNLHYRYWISASDLLIALSNADKELEEIRLLYKKRKKQVYL